jgi:hypothetical protein
MDLNYKLAANPRDLTRVQINFLMASIRIRKEVEEVAQLAEEGVTRIIFGGEE